MTLNTRGNAHLKAIKIYVQINFDGYLNASKNRFKSQLF